MFYNGLIIVDSLSKHNGNFWSYTEAQTTSFRISRCTTDWYVDYAFVRDVNPPHGEVYMNFYTTRHSVLTSTFQGRECLLTELKKTHRKNHGKEPNGRSGGKEVCKYGASEKGGGKANNTRWNTSLLLQLRVTSGWETKMDALGCKVNRSRIQFQF